jgi:hypothetical protein
MYEYLPETLIFLTVLFELFAMWTLTAMFSPWWYNCHTTNRVSIIRNKTQYHIILHQPSIFIWHVWTRHIDLELWWSWHSYIYQTIREHFTLSYMWYIWESTVIMKKFYFEILKNVHDDNKEVVFGMLFVCFCVYGHVPQWSMDFTVWYLRNYPSEHSSSKNRSCSRRTSKHKTAIFLRYRMAASFVYRKF